MDRAQWADLSKRIRQAVKAVGPTPRAQYSDALILLIYCWEVANDRPLCWGCKRENYGGIFRPRALPSVSQFCRRVKTSRFQAMLQHLHDQLTNDSRLSQVNFLDGKPLPVGNYSRDPEARNGFGAGQFMRGYKLHVLVSDDRRIASWSVMPMNAHEMNVARVIIDQLPHVPRGSMIMADGNYDSHVLHKDIFRRNAWLWLKPRGMAEHPVTLRQMGPARRELLRAWRDDPAGSERLNDYRVHVEGTFSNLTCYSGGLGPLPAFVRRLERVRRWVGAKIILYHVRLEHRKANASLN